MKKSLKKNQVIITVLAIMIAVAGYINYSGDLRTMLNSTKEAATANAEDVLSNDIDGGDVVQPGDAVLTSATVSSIISEAKLNREQVRAKNKETLLNIVNNTSVSESAKSAAVKQIAAIADAAEKEMAAELLLEAKGFSNAVVSIVDSNVEVVIGKASITDTERVQIEDIVKRKTGASADKITINICNK